MKRCVASAACNDRLLRVASSGEFHPALAKDARLLRERLQAIVASLGLLLERPIGGERRAGAGDEEGQGQRPGQGQAKTSRGHDQGDGEEDPQGIPARSSRIP